MNPGREETVKAAALDVGFSLAGIAGVLPHEKSNESFGRWLNAGMQAEMAYLARHRESRVDVRRLFPEARSAVCVALNYYQEVEREQRDADGRDGRGVFSVCVHGKDYHRVIGEMLRRLDDCLRESFPGLRSVACVDTRPVSDREMAIRAGIGWLGKNTSVISPRYGSWIFLGELITNLDLEPDIPLDTLCATCTRCIDACPVGALDEPFLVDARKCISYLTIEKRGNFPPELREGIGLHVFGCDICQSVCPHNQVASPSKAFARSDRSGLVDMTLDELSVIADGEFLALTEGSAIRRCKPEGMRRNAVVSKRNLAFRSGKAREAGKRKT